jgi:hypothetical protein
MNKKEKINKNFWIVVQHSVFLVPIYYVLRYFQKDLIRWGAEDFMIYFMNWILSNLAIGLIIGFAVLLSIVRWYE